MCDFERERWVTWSGTTAKKLRNEGVALCPTLSGGNEFEDLCSSLSDDQVTRLFDIFFPFRKVISGHSVLFTSNGRVTERLKQAHDDGRLFPVEPTDLDPQPFITTLYGIYKSLVAVAHDILHEFIADKHAVEQMLEGRRFEMLFSQDSFCLDKPTAGNEHLVIYGGSSNVVFQKRGYRFPNPTRPNIAIVKEHGLAGVGDRVGLSDYRVFGGCTDAISLAFFLTV